MGSACSGSTKKNSKNDQKGDEQVTDKKNVKVSPEQFVLEREGNFKQYYKLGPVLGSGAFGEVRICQGRDSGVQRAVKILTKGFIDEKEKERFLAEICILKRLDHPNIVKLFEIYQDQKRYFLVTDLCTGGELFDRIVNNQNFNENDAARIVKQILSAVVYCHANNIVHRDLKPENLLLETKQKDANIKVIDFGTSQIFTTDKKMIQKFGTPYYIAPEVLSKSYNEKCDVWSCGVILYILLCGYPPFSGKTDTEILHKVKKGKEWEKISTEAKDLVRQMLTFDANKRCKAEAALNHVWIKEKAGERLDIKTASKVLSNLKSFRASQKMQQAALTYIVSHLTSREEKEELQKTFSQLDLNGDGKLSKEELCIGNISVRQFSCYEKIFGSGGIDVKEEVDKIFEAVDVDGNGFLDYTEFALATVNTKRLITHDRLRIAFDMFDKDGGGTISADEVQEVLGQGMNIATDVWKQVINEVDEDEDGEISFPEFEKMMKKLVDQLSTK